MPEKSSQNFSLTRSDAATSQITLDDNRLPNANGCDLFDSKSVPSDQSSAIPLVQSQWRQLVHLKAMLESFGVALFSINLKTDENALLFATGTFCDIMAIDINTLRKEGLDAIAGRIPLADRARANPLLIQACLDRSIYTVDVRLESGPGLLVVIRLSGNCVDNGDGVLLSLLSEQLDISSPLSFDNCDDSWRMFGADLTFCVSHLIAADPDSGWLVPFYEVSDVDLIQEEIMNAIPLKSRKTILAAVKAHDYHMCMSVAGTFPNFNRWIAGLVGRDANSGVTSKKVLELLDKTTRLESVSDHIWALTQLSVAIRNPSLFLTSMEPLARIVTNRSSRPTESFWKGLAQHWLLLLWGCLLKKLGLGTDAQKVLDTLYEILEAFSCQFRYSKLVAHLKGIVAYNLLHQNARDGELASVWIARLLEIHAVAPLPKPCRETLNRISRLNIIPPSL